MQGVSVLELCHNGRLNAPNEPADNYQTTYDSKTKLVVFYSCIFYTIVQTQQPSCCATLSNNAHTLDTWAICDLHNMLLFLDVHSYSLHKSKDICHLLQCYNHHDGKGFSWILPNIYPDNSFDCNCTHTFC